MQTIYLFHNYKWYLAIWPLLFALALILLWYNKNRWKEGYTVFFWLSTISVGIVYCPFLATVLVPHFLPSFAEYERLSWVFFEIPLISYILIMLAYCLKEKKSRHIFVVAFLVVLLLLGGPNNTNFFEKPQNKYKISQDVITVCDKLDTLSPSNPITLCIQLESERIYHSGVGQDGNLYYGIRTYESRFRLMRYYVSPEKYTNNSFKLADALPEEIDYYLCPKNALIYHELERLGYTYIDESENFAIFHNQNKAMKE